MIAQRRTKLTAAQERLAYAIATERDSIDGFEVCQRCLRDCGGVHRDHRQNRDDFNTVPSNLQLLGAGCHNWKTEHPTDAILDGWAVPRHTTLTPAEWPARRRIRTRFGTTRLAWVLYDDHGGYLEIDDTEARYRMFKGGVLDAA